MQKLSSS